MQSTTDVRSINKWLKARGLDLISEQSAASFIIPGVCAGQFLICEQNVLIFDSLVSNPYVSGLTRDRALDTIIPFMLDFSKKMNAARVLALSIDGRTIGRAEKFGFKKQPHVVLTYKG